MSSPPALAQVEPLLKSSKTAVDALTSNLVEVEAVVRDISEVTGSMAEASNAVSSVTDSAAGAVQKLFNKVKAPRGRRRSQARRCRHRGRAAYRARSDW